MTVLPEAPGPESTNRTTPHRLSTGSPGAAEMSDLLGTVLAVRASQYRQQADAVKAFIESFGRLAACVEPVADGWSERFAPRLGMEARVTELWGDVVLKAGKAAEPLQRSGGLIAYKPGGTMRTVELNPALVWSTIFDPMPMVTPNLVLTTAGQSLGVIEGRYEIAVERERGLAGLLGRFVGFPTRVREAAGLHRGTVGGGALMTVVATFQILLVTVVGGALVFPLVRYLGWGP